MKDYCLRTTLGDDLTSINYIYMYTIGVTVRVGQHNVDDGLLLNYATLPHPQPS